MSHVRAEILDVDSPNSAAARIVINAPAAKIFEVLADPRAHALFDGSATIKESISGPARLHLGAKFSMAMKIKVPYRITNTVVAFEENKKVTWCHFMKWTWSYELQDLGSSTTQVTEIFDGNTIPAFSRWWLKKTGAVGRNPKFMAKSLVQLKALCEG
jgi:uncharacterized protein YndB with AHSA1/START domain